MLNGACSKKKIMLNGCLEKKKEKKKKREAQW
jgi:hypothetical protein